MSFLSSKNTPFLFHFKFRAFDKLLNVNGGGRGFATVFCQGKMVRAGVIKAWRAFQMAWQLLCDIETETEKSVRTTPHNHSGTKPEPANIN